MRFSDSLPRRLRVLSALLAGALTLAIAFECTLVVHAQMPQVSVSPAVATIGIGQTLDLEVLLTDVQGLYTAQLTFQYDPAVLEVMDVQLGPLLAGRTPAVSADVDNENGQVRLSVTLTSPASPVDGSGVLAIIVIQGESEGGSVLALEPMLSDVNGMPLPARARAGILNVSSNPPPTEVPQATDTPTPEDTPVPTETIEPAKTPSTTETLFPPTLPPAAADTPSPATVTAMPTPSVPEPSATAPEGVSTPIISPTPGSVPVGTPPAGPPPTVVAQAQPPTPTQPAGGAPETPTPTRAPILPSLGEKELPWWLFATLLAIIVLLIVITGIIVLVALYAWYRRAGQSR